ncbi:MAG: hypothetical protein Q4E53_06220 [Eubacteriales bacterium]|nr:hypothetical protein [Eubacteriales bacterium]
MNIDCNQLKKIYVPRVKRIANDEEFFAVPNASDYAFTNYGRLYKKVADNAWHKVPMQYDTQLRAEAVPIRYDNAEHECPIAVCRLMKDVFLPNVDGILYSPSWNTLDKNRYCITRWCVLTKNELTETISNKAAGQSLDNVNEKLIFFLNQELLKIRELSAKIYQSVKTRCTNEGYKEKFPLYKDATMSPEWSNNPAKARQFIIDNIYPYPSKLVMDKDLMTFGEGNTYAEGTVVMIPYAYNNVFSKSTSALPYSIKMNQNKEKATTFTVPQSATKENSYTVENYEEALEIARKCKANYIRGLVAYERKAGFMPEFILKKMAEWADACELGLITIWETAADTELEQLILNGGV